MELRNAFTVPAGIDDAWRLMLDVRALAPCMPGASVDEVRGDEVLGQVRVKLGPIALTYRGTVTFLERDEEKHRVVLDAKAKEARGGGTAGARITASMEPAADGTGITVVTDLRVTGKPAQFGRGVMADVSERIIGQFAANLAERLKAPQTPEGQLNAAAQKAGTAPGSVTAHPRTEESLDLLQAAGVRRVLVPALVAGGAAIVAIAFWLGRRSR
ncbi:SRPBCC family protein [Actinoplanes sp. NPDC051411]|uniref:SRPBCC family protein n=1 Tax=Actinoplanes sp. NPDC051411 TaxID=3155522 RepID=UPI003446E34B